MSKIYDRKLKKYYEEEQYLKDVLNFLYKTKIGRILLKVLINKIFSKFMGFYYKSGLSLKKVESFIKNYDIRLDNLEKSNFDSFDDFFTRKIKDIDLKIDKNPKTLISPANAKLIVYKISQNLRITVKNSNYYLKDLLNDEDLSRRYEGGLCLIYRLTVDDYHRYCYIDEGYVIGRRIIDGVLHTVSSISEGYEIYIKNQREYELISTKNIGSIIQMEVGAILVGKITNHKKEYHKKGQEKGYFSFGGSTIIIILEKGRVVLDEDIVNHSLENIETKVEYGEKIGFVI